MYFKSDYISPGAYVLLITKKFVSFSEGAGGHVFTHRPALLCKTSVRPGKRWCGTSY